MLTLDDLTVGDVSGMIAAAVTTVHMLVILAVPLIVLAIFNGKRNSNTTASAVTWSVVGRSLHSSWWPFLVHADSAAKKGVPAQIVFATRLRTFMVLLASISSIVTPLGLYQTILPSGKTTQPSFHYIADPSDFGVGTVPRSNLQFSRICGGWLPVECPNSFSNVTTVINDTGEYSWTYSYDSRVPQYVMDAFESGLATMNRSVSSIFDIQPRSYTWGEINNSPDGIQPDNNSSYPVSSFRQISTMTTENKFLAIEGLIVDMVNGGIGFRNHSAPPVTPFGSTWSEDLLFIEPESVCVDLNITIDFMLPLYSSQGTSVWNLVLTDRGGFVNLNHTYPTWESWADRQNQPDLYLRAYRAGWLNNAYSMAFMNITSIHNDSDPGSEPFEYVTSSLGQTFPLAYPDGTGAALYITTPDLLTTTSLFGGYLYGLDQGVSGVNTTSFTNSSENVTTSSYPPLYPNPWGINESIWSDVGLACQGAGGLDLANITNAAAQCGLMYGAPRRQGEGSSILFDPGSNWSMPLYSCITTTKAIIKTVSLQFNGSDDLSGLTVSDIQDKVYADNASIPLWGVEQTNNTLTDVLPLWGLLSSADQGNISLSTLQKEFLYLPGYLSSVSGFTPGASYQNLPGVNFYADAIGTAFDIYNEGYGLTDYTGQSNLALFRQWQELSQSPTDAARILNLVWTDSAANSVVGTKTLQDPQQQALQKRDSNTGASAASSSLLPEVLNYKRRVQYHYPYGIPAFLTLLLTVGLLMATLVATLLGRSGPNQMRSLLNKTSQGRILTSRIHKSERQLGQTGSPGSREAVMSGISTKQWVRSDGSTPITLVEEDSQRIQYQPIAQVS